MELEVSEIGLQERWIEPNRKWKIW